MAQMKNLLVVCGLVALGCTCTAVAQNYPTRPLSIVVPFPAGGPTDTIGRIMAERMTHQGGIKQCDHPQQPALTGHNRSIFFTGQGR